MVFAGTAGFFTVRVVLGASFFAAGALVFFTFREGPAVVLTLIEDSGRMVIDVSGRIVIEVSGRMVIEVSGRMIIDVSGRTLIEVSGR